MKTLSTILTAVCALTSTVLASAPLPLEQWQQQGENTLRQQQQRFEALQDRLLREKAASSLAQPIDPNRPLVLNEKPCFSITSVSLLGEEAERFQLALRQALRETHFQEGICLGAQGIQVLMEHVQNAIIANGYSTTRVVAGRQNLVSGHLVLTVIPGRIRAIRYDQTHKDETHVGRIMAWGNQFPLRAGDILNLHELEQGLENLRRTPTAEAQLEIVPADQPNFSDVVVSWRQRLIPWRLMLSVDDAGNRYTGKYQGNVTIAADNPLGLSDLFYVNFSHDLGHKTHLVDEEGHSTNSRTQGFGLHYSVPFGRWVFAVNHQTYEYHQAIEGLQDNYDYSGKSRLTTLDVRRLLYRDAQRKTHGHLAFWTRENESFIDGVALEVQHRRQTGWTLGFAHQEQLGDLVVDLGLDYKRGTGANQSALSPETGGSHLQLFTWDIALTWPFSVLGQPLSFQSAFHGQHNLTPLTVHDQIAIGGRYTVRGFSGDVTLMAEHGWYWQNTLSWSYLPTHQLYLGLDTGRIGGESADYQLGRTLTGSVFGIRGQWQGWGALYYDAFIGRTLQKPEYFQTDPYTTGFTVTWTF